MGFKKRKELVKQFTLLLLLMLTWYVLSGYSSAFFLGLGAFSTIVSFLVYRYLYHDQKPLDFCPTSVFRFPLYLLWLCKEVLLSSWQVAIQVWTRNPQVDPVLDWVDMEIKGDIAITTYANSITLTPGTVSVKVEDGKILVHALRKETLADLKSFTMERKVDAAINGRRT
jgi:multicomponent Na+:H+ antiporter subunit E